MDRQDKGKLLASGARLLSGVTWSVPSQTLPAKGYLVNTLLGGFASRLKVAP